MAPQQHWVQKIMRAFWILSWSSDIWGLHLQKTLCKKNHKNTMAQYMLPIIKHTSHVTCFNCRVYNTIDIQRFVVKGESCWLISAAIPAVQYCYWPWTLTSAGHIKPATHLKQKSLFTSQLNAVWVCSQRMKLLEHVVVGMQYLCRCLWCNIWSDWDLDNAVMPNQLQLELPDKVLRRTEKTLQSPVRTDNNHEHT
jgi:hypothetical protein